MSSHFHELDFEHLKELAQQLQIKGRSATTQEALADALDEHFREQALRDAACAAQDRDMSASKVRRDGGNVLDGPELQ